MPRPYWILYSTSKQLLGMKVRSGNFKRWVHQEVLTPEASQALKKLLQVSQAAIQERSNGYNRVFFISQSLCEASASKAVASGFWLNPTKIHDQWSGVLFIRFFFSVLNRVNKKKSPKIRSSRVGATCAPCRPFIRQIPWPHPRRHKQRILAASVLSTFNVKLHYWQRKNNENTVRSRALRCCWLKSHGQ